MTHRAFVAALVVLVIAIAAQPGRTQQAGVETRPPNAPEQKPAFAGQTRAPERKADVAFDVVTVVEGLETPWGMTFLPDGRMLVTEKGSAGRGGAVTAEPRMRILADGKFSEPIAGLPPIDARGQGGLLDVALDPQYATNRVIYWSYSEPQAENMNNTAVARGTLVDGPTPRVENVQVIFHMTPPMASQQHYGSRLVFGRDGTLFITLGERSIIGGRMQAQRLDGTLGKVVRVNRDGTIPKDNPFVGKDGVRAGDLVVRSPQHPGRGAASDDRRTVDRRARRAGRRRAEHPAEGQGLRLADDHLRRELRRRSRSAPASRSRPAWSSRSTTGIR